MIDNYNYETASMTGIPGPLKWESLKKRRKDSILILLYKGLKGKTCVYNKGYRNLVRVENKILRYQNFKQHPHSLLKRSRYTLGTLT